MSWLPLVALYLLGRRGDGPAWPGPDSPPPRRARHAPPPPHGHAPPVHHEAPHHEAPHSADEHHQAHAEHHDAAPHAEHDAAPHAEHGAAPHYKNLDFSHAPQHDAPPAPEHAMPWHMGPAHHAAPHHDAPVHHDAPPAPAAGEYSIRSLQRILVGLGWRGHLTTRGAVTSDLTDGLYGPVTHDDWQQSATKRHLDPTFIRLGPTTAHVDPDTYAQLRALAAQSGAVVGVGGGQFIRIP